MSQAVNFGPDVVKGRLLQALIVSDETPGDVVDVQLPDWAIGFRIRVKGSIGDGTYVVYALNEEPAIGESDTFAVGNVAHAGETDTRLLMPGKGRILQTIASDSVLEFWLEIF